MALHNQSLSQKVTIYDLLTALKDTINYNMNCVKIATVLEFNPDLLTVKCRINNKRLKNLKQDGNQILENYPDIYAKVHFFGWGDVGSTYPITPGMEGILLFNDRELETWFTTSEPGQLAYDRCHDLTDALFICGLHSQKNIELLPYLDDCLHLFYKSCNIQIKDGTIILNGDTVINGNLQVNGWIHATGDIVAGTISLQNHVHSGVQPGGGNTSKPIP